ncbi:MAG: aminopeptidase N [Pseudomonadota bacterium]
MTRSTFGAAGARPEGAPAHQTVRLEDYQPPPWLVERVRLVFQLHETETRVRAQLQFRRNPAGPSATGPRPDLRLDGRALTPRHVALDGAAPSAGALSVDPAGLVIDGAALPGDAFLWECETLLDPSSNTALEGLYLSRGVFCTQCEAQGFRKITYFPDRPDVMAVYSVRVEADEIAQPVLLSNGEPSGAGPLPDGRHFVEWRDPHPKPCYLFALVAGDLSCTTDVFDTASGRRVDLQLFTRPGDEPKAGYALDALKRAMRWDERAYGFGYDLDLFMIVAVDDFNMGAMENKGLNIFNSRYVLASPETATDTDYELIESVVAHEYFHNWTGNRITCRDWFQLCLKEGLTVFRDQQFTEAERSAAVARIDTVRALRARQFREDAGPLAHPVRPNSYKEINNFYTATVYEKGAEIVRMLQTLLGPDLYRRAMDLYVERHDGQAATLEQFVACFEAASGQDLTQFFRWWTTPGTPWLTVEERFFEEEGAFQVTISQRLPTAAADAASSRAASSRAASSPPTPSDAASPMVIPLRIGLLDRSGAEIALPEPDGARAEGGRLFVLDGPRKTWRFEGLQKGAAARPVLSINRGFAAPVAIERKGGDAAQLAADRALLLTHDSDPFNRWEAARSLALDAILRMMHAIAEADTRGFAAMAGEQTAPASSPAAALDAHAAPLVEALGSALIDPRLDPAFKALLFALPSEDELAGEIAAQGARAADPDAIHAARTQIRLSLASGLRASLLDTYHAMATPGPYRPTAEDAGKRALRNACMGLLAQLREPETTALAASQFDRADNMTDQLPALTALVHTGAPMRGEKLALFYERWRDDALVLGKWFGVQASSPLESALDEVRALTEHSAFEWRNPNKFRALIGAFAMGNTVNFHRKDGAGYRFLADWLIRLDPVNPQTAAKVAGAFETWRRYDELRQGLIRDELRRIHAAEGVSRDMREMLDRMLD